MQTYDQSGKKKQWYNSRRWQEGVPTAFTWIWKYRKLALYCAVYGLQERMILKKYFKFAISKYLYKYTTPDVLYHPVQSNMVLNSQQLQSLHHWKMKNGKLKRHKTIAWLNFYWSIFVPDIKYNHVTVLAGANSVTKWGSHLTAKETHSNNRHYTHWKQSSQLWALQHPPSHKFTPLCKGVGEQHLGQEVELTFIPHKELLSCSLKTWQAHNPQVHLSGSWSPVLLAHYSPRWCTCSLLPTGGQEDLL